MKRSIWIFLLAILLPSVGLGWLALRSAGEQQIILERRTAELYQKETDAVADAARALIEEERRGFAQTVRALLANESALGSGARFCRQAGARLAAQSGRLRARCGGQSGFAAAQRCAGAMPSGSNFSRTTARFFPAPRPRQFMRCRPTN